MRAVILSLLLAGSALGQETVLRNPTGRTIKDEVVRLLVPAPAGGFVVRVDGKVIPHQVESIGGKRWIWVCADFEPRSERKFTIAAGAAAEDPKRVTLKKDGPAYTLDNGLVAVRVPAETGGEIAGPIAGLRIADGKWVGASSWQTRRKLKSFSSTVVGDGTLFAKVRLRYDFDGPAGIDASEPAFAEIDVSLSPGQAHAAIFERHEMGREDSWEFDASRGWKPTQGFSKPFSGGAGSGEVVRRPEPNRPLRPGGVPFAPEELFINLFPRWNQHFKDGWYFAAGDGSAHVGAVVVRASQWVWPHDNAIAAVVKESADYAGLRLSTWHGQRLWWLIGPSLAPADVAYVSRHAWEHLDKLNHEFVLDWPGVSKGAWVSMNFYDGGQMNPTGPLRGQGRQALASASKEGDLSTLYRVQVMMHPDAWGSYWNYWSPENPNFFTDFMKVPIALTAQLRNHPQFERFRAAAEAKLREDLYHSFTLSGGAGQECPGYSLYAAKHIADMAPMCREYLKFDPTQWEQFKAGAYFQKRISQPDGAVRRQLPMGDTHPDKKTGGPATVDVTAQEAGKFRTEELPGFGVIFNHQAGTPRETYLAFKAGPNRGHYHGDQLAFHLGMLGRPLAVDHHCSYSPRAGQEHMHNRVAFSTEEMPHANMDGYERLIAFKTSDSADVAMGQVESPRLRKMEKLPPEIWHQEYPQKQLTKPLTYRRTVVLVKGGDRDYVVIRDEYWAGEALSATYCLHVRSDQIKQSGNVVEFGNLTLLRALPEEARFESFPWSHANGGTETTQGARFTIRAEAGEFVTLLYPGPLPADVKPIAGGVQVGKDRVTFGKQPAVTVMREGKAVLTLDDREINLDRSQGNIGLFVPDAGYPFGPIPDWLIRQRAGRPQWAK